MSLTTRGFPISCGLLAALLSLGAAPEARRAVDLGIEPQQAGPATELPPEKLEAHPGGPARPGRPATPVIDPTLREESMGATTLDVYVFLASASGRGEAALRSAKERHLPGLRDLSGRIVDLERRYRPSVPIPRDQEGAWSAGIEAAISPDDREERLRLQLELDAGLHVMRGDLARAIRERVGATQDEVAAAIEELGGTVHAKVLTSNVLLVTLPALALDELGLHPRVRRIVPRHEGQPCLDVSVPSCGYPTFWNNGFTGVAYDAGIVDTGFQQDHPAFAGKTIYRTEPDPVDLNGHGTHVGGIITSTNTTYLGTAYGLDKFFWGKAGGYAFATLDAVANDFPDSPEVMNQSWAYGMANVEDYNYEDEWFDTYVEAFDIMVTLGAANSSWSDTQPTIHHPAAGFNPITVANMHPNRTITRADDVRAGDSSVGPTLYGRRKPDIAAPGTWIVSTHAFWSGGGSGAGGSCWATDNHNDFSICSGTSMAAPHVAGGLLLLHDGGAFESMSQKAVLFNTADWWTSNDTETTADDGEVTVPAGFGITNWDKSYGWGYMDLDHAYFHRTDHHARDLVPRNDNADEDDYKLFVGTLHAGEKVTLVWERRGIYDPDKYAASTYALSDLDLWLYDGDTGVLVDRDATVSDNVHQVATATDRNVVAKVEAWSTSFDGASTEPFVLATEEGFVSRSFPDQFMGWASYPTAGVEPSEEFEIEFWLVNNVDLASHANVLDLILPPGWALLEGADPVPLLSIPAGASSVHAVWRVRAQGTPQPGARILVKHTHSSYDETFGPQSWAIDVDVEYDSTPPFPNPMTWWQIPFGFSTWGIEMGATAAGDVHPVQYQFDFFYSTTSSPGGTSSGWLPGTVYIDDGLAPNGEYCYRARARDVTIGNNTTGFSSTECAWTFIEPVSGIAIADVGRDRIAVYSVNTPTGLTRGSSGLEIVNDTLDISSGWRQDNAPYYFHGLTPNTNYVFWGTSRNGGGMPTPPSPWEGRYTLASPPIPLGFSRVGPHEVQVDLDPLDPNPEGTEYQIHNVVTGQDSGWGGTEWFNTGLSCDATYWYQARAVNGDGSATEWIEMGPVTTPIDQDLDGDSVALCQGDCDDGNPFTYPGAPEICDGLDNDCDELVDEDDLDGDGSPDCVDPDDDNDGWMDVQDCAPREDWLWSPPGPLELTVTATGGAAELRWSPPAEPGSVVPPVYDTLASFVVTDFGPSAWCAEAGGTDLSTLVGDPVAPGEVLYFVVRGVNACGAGDGGTGPGGLPRELEDCS